MQEKILQEFDGFAKSLRSKDKVAILTDSDTDGITAGVIVFKAVEKLTGREPMLVILGRPESQALKKDLLKNGLVKALKRFKISGFIAVDVSLDQKPGKRLAEEIAKFAKVLNIDHHKLYGKFKSKNAVLVKPQMFSKKDPSRYASAKLCFDLFSRVCDLKGNEWLAALGLFGDFGWNDWRGFFEKSLQKARISEERIKELHEILSAVKTLDEKKLPECFKDLLHAKPKNALRKFGKFKKEFEKEMKKEQNNFFKKVEHFPKLQLYFYISKSKYSIASPLINELSQKFPNSTIIIGRREDGEVKISARRQDRKIAVNELLEKAIKGLKGAIAGGHKPAAGGKILAKDLGKFKKNLLQRQKWQSF